MAALTRNVFLEAALAYAARGWPVFPCSPDTKQPLTKNGFKDATTDPATLRQWWRRWSDAMIGLPTGLATGVLVVDLDPTAPATAEQLLAALRQAVGEALPPCPLLRTPREGMHLYLAYPKALPAGLTESGVIGNRAGIIPGIDLRGEGGYVVTAPSRRFGAKSREVGLEGKTYAWEADAGLDDLDLPAPSETLLRFLTSKHEEEAPPPAAPRAGAAVDVDAKVRKYALSALDGEARAVAQAPKGQRNQVLNTAAFALGQLVGAGALSEAVVVAALEEAAAASGLAKEDGIKSVRATLRSGLQGGRSKPRDLSEIAQPSRNRPAAPQGEQSGRARPAPADKPPQAAAPEEGGGGGEPPDDIPREVLEACAAEPQNDTGNARRLLAHFGRDLLAVRDVGPHAWTGTHWEPQGAKEVLARLAQRAAERIKLEAEVMPRIRGEEEENFAKRQTARRKFAISSGNATRLKAMVDCALPHITVHPDQLDAEALAINLQNGTLRLFKERFREVDPDCPDPDVERYIEGTRWALRLDAHARADRCTKIMPVSYDPAAACPKWQEFMARFQPKPAIRRFLQAFHGYALTGLMGEQAFCFNYGLGANGKSTFMEAIARLQGAYAQVLPAEALTGDMQRRGDQATPEYARLPGARLVRCAELPRGQGFRESTLKLLTGGEAMLVRHLHQGFFEMRPSFKAIGSGNDRPNIGGVDEGIWRRIKLVPWEVTIPAAERRPMERVLRDFTAEGPGILNWLLEGLLDYLENGLVVPAEIQAATESYRSDMDPVGEFTASCVVADEGGQGVTARELYNAYVDWCAANSVKAWAEKTFAGVMVQKGFKKESGRIRRYLDIALKDVPTNPEREPGGYGQHY